MHLGDIVAGHGAHSLVQRARSVPVKASQALHAQVLREQAMEFRQHHLGPRHIIPAANRIDFVPEFPAINHRLVAVPLGIPGELFFELLAALLSVKEVGNSCGGPASRDVVERFRGPLAAAALDRPEMLDGHFHANVVRAGEGEQGINPFCFFFIVHPAAFVLDIPEPSAEPHADIVAAVLGQPSHPPFKLRHLLLGGPSARRMNDVQANRDIRLAI